jgi:hydroxyethylthiazole kinase
MHAPRDLPLIAADTLARIRARRPRVHCITNAVAQQFTANMLLAADAVPSMTTDPAEIAEFVARADALLVNLGTLDAERHAAIDIALAAAGERVPWALDPVLIDRSAPRAALAATLAARRPRAIRLNGAEFATLAGGELGPDALARYAQNRATVIGLTGVRDVVTDGGRSATIANGHPLMAKVTAMGCAASALVAACLAVETDAWRATVAGLILIGVAGDVAGEPSASRGPGSFAVAIIDALHGLDEKTILERARLGA